MSVPAVFALFLREERKSVAFCEYGERQMVLRGLERGGENVETGVPAVFALFLREERRSVAFCEYGERRMALRGLERGGGER